MAAVQSELSSAQQRVATATTELRSAQAELDAAIRRGDAPGAMRAQSRVARAQTELVSATNALTQATTAGGTTEGGGTNGGDIIIPSTLPPDDLGGDPNAGGGGVYVPVDYPPATTTGGGYDYNGGTMPTPSPGPGGGPNRPDEATVLGALRQMRRDADSLPVRYEPSENPPATMAQGYLGVLLDVGTWLLSSPQGQRAQDWFFTWLHEDAEPVFDRVAAGNGSVSTNTCDFLYKKLNKAEKDALEAWWQRNSCPIAADYLEGNARQLYLLIQLSHSAPPPSCGCAIGSATAGPAHQGRIGGR